MISSQELIHIVETAFLPKRCACSIDSVGKMTIQIFNQNTGKEELQFADIDSSNLTAGRAIANLVLGLREELRLWHMQPEQQRQQYRRA